MLESRLFKIVYYLLEKGKATAPELAAKFEVSTRTIYRDIDLLSEAGIPIYATQGKGGGIYLLDDFVLDKSLFNTSEQEQILMALQEFSAIDIKGADELLTKLGALFQTNVTNWIEVDVSNWGEDDTRQEMFGLIKRAIYHKNEVSFCYFSGKGEKTKRLVQPAKLVFKNNNWYLYGYCLLRKDYRFFKLTRIVDLKVEEKTFVPGTVPPLRKKQFIREETVSVTLKFDKSAAFRVYDEFPDKVTKDEEGNFIVQTDLPVSNILYSYILSFADCVEVVEPQEIREQIKQKLKVMQKKYET